MCDRNDIMLQSTFFWEACKVSCREKKQSKLLIDLFVSKFEIQKDILSAVYFPFCHEKHWYVGIINLVTRQFEYAEGLKAAAPPNFVVILTFVMRSICGEDFLKDWKIKRAYRRRCIQQKDGHNCGVIALSFIQASCVDIFDDGDDWCNELASAYRIRWLERIISRHDSAWIVDDPKRSAFIRARVVTHF